MIYIDSSVALAHLFGEGRSPPLHFWQEELVSSELLECEVWNRVHARGYTGILRDSASDLISRLRLLEMTRPVLARAMQPYPIAVRTLDALHLATIDFLMRQGEAIELASYDTRMLAAARALGIPSSELQG